MSMIVCATDLSPESVAVVSKAADLGRLLGLPLQLFHLFDVPFSPDILDEIADDLRRSAEAALTAQAEPLRAEGLDVRTCVQLGVKDDIVRHARAIDAKLLVLGTHARRGAARFFLGSCAEHAIRTAPCPVVVIPPASHHQPARPRPNAPLEVVAAIDFSPASDAALAWLRGLLERTPCNVRLLHLYSPAREHQRLGFDPPMPFEVNREVVDTLARDLRAHVHAQVGSDFSLRIRPNWGGEEDPLAWEAEMDGADFLIIGTSQTRRSTALTTVRGSHLPVVCVPKLGSPPRPEPLAPIRTVLALTDFSRSGNAAIAQAYRLLHPGGGDVVLAHVAEPDRFGLDPTREEEIENCLLALVPEERGSQGLILSMLVERNLALPSLREFLLEDELAIAQPYIDRFRFRAGELASGLSGGNQQKIVLGKWMARKPKVLLLDEPTRGLDVRAKRDVHDVVRELAAAGTGIIVSSSEAEEVAALCHRALVLAQGKSRGELAREQLTDANILRYAAA